MWNQLGYIQAENAAELYGQNYIWRTCRRTIAFQLPGVQSNNSLGQTFRGWKAFQNLVEVCSGLHSPLVGETEVYGQFRQFRQSHILPEIWNHFFDAVEEDVKKIRREFLIGIGSQSYGSVVRKYLNEKSPIVLVGAGQLAKEILPYFENREVHVVARNPQRAKQNLGEQIKLSEALPSNASWVIAAPFCNSSLREKLNDPAQIIDLRAEDFLQHDCPSISLNEIFKQLEDNRAQLSQRKDSAMERIAALVGMRQNSMTHRPYGWEDAFA